MKYTYLIKQYILFCCLFSFFILAGCESKKETGTIIFDSYHISLHTATKYEKQNHKSNDKIKPEVYNYLLAIYRATHNTQGFNDNILISFFPNDYNTLEEFVLKNTEDISISNYSQDNDKETILNNCKEEIALLVQQSHITNDEETRYFIQAFFLDKGKAYIVSAGTENEKEADILYNDFKNISCINKEKN